MRLDVTPTPSVSDDMSPAPALSDTAVPSPTPTGSTAAAATSGVDSLLAVLWFGVGALLLGCLIYGFVTWHNKAKGITFIRLYALIVVAVLAVMLATADVASDAKVAAFTLLGTIAGYLAGSRTPETTETKPAEDGGGSTTTVTPIL